MLVLVDDQLQVLVHKLLIECVIDFLDALLLLEHSHSGQALVLLCLRRGRLSDGAGSLLLAHHRVVKHGVLHILLIN